MAALPSEAPNQLAPPLYFHDEPERHSSQAQE
jgi:hypothetical protein